MPYIALYPSDYLADTAHLGLTEHGVYWRMLLHYYQHCKPFPNDLEKINRVILASTPEEKRVAEYVLGEFFVLHKHDDGAFYWHHARADWEISAAEARHLSAVERGKKGGRPRNKAELNLSFTSAKAEPKQPEPEPEPEPEKEETIKPLSDKSDVPANFEELWKAYPKKVGKSEALKAWKALKINGEFPEILKSLERQKLSKKWQEGFILDPVRWIKGKRWEDVVEAEIDYSKALQDGITQLDFGEDWKNSASGIQAKGLSLGLEQQVGEAFPLFKIRVIEASRPAA